MLHVTEGNSSDASSDDGASPTGVAPANWLMVHNVSQLARDGNCHERIIVFRHKELYEFF
jgi:hypothetical protein